MILLQQGEINQSIQWEREECMHYKSLYFRQYLTEYQFMVANE